MEFHMPFKSKAQMRWMFAAEERGEVPKGTTKKWLKHTKNKSKLPEKKKENKTNKKAEFDHKEEIKNIIKSAFNNLATPIQHPQQFRLPIQPKTMIQFPQQVNMKNINQNTQNNNLPADIFGQSLLPNKNRPLGSGPGALSPSTGTIAHPIKQFPNTEGQMPKMGAEDTGSEKTYKDTYKDKYRQEYRKGLERYNLVKYQAEHLVGLLNKYGDRLPETTRDQLNHYLNDLLELRNAEGLRLEALKIFLPELEDSDFAVPDSRTLALIDVANEKWRRIGAKYGDESLFGKDLLNKMFTSSFGPALSDIKAKDPNLFDQFKEDGRNLVPSIILSNLKTRGGRYPVTDDVPEPIREIVNNLTNTWSSWWTIDAKNQAMESISRGDDRDRWNKAKEDIVPRSLGPYVRSTGEPVQPAEAGGIGIPSGQEPTEQSQQGQGGINVPPGQTDEQTIEQTGEASPPEGTSQPNAGQAPGDTRTPEESAEEQVAETQDQEDIDAWWQTYMGPYFGAQLDAFKRLRNEASPELRRMFNIDARFDQLKMLQDQVDQTMVEVQNNPTPEMLRRYNQLRRRYDTFKNLFLNDIQRAIDYLPYDTAKQPQEPQYDNAKKLPTTQKAFPGPAAQQGPEQNGQQPTVTPDLLEAWGRNVLQGFHRLNKFRQRTGVRQLTPEEQKEKLRQYIKQQGQRAGIFGLGVDDATLDRYVNNILTMDRVGIENVERDEFGRLIPRVPIQPTQEQQPPIQEPLTQEQPTQEQPPIPEPPTQEPQPPIQEQQKNINDQNRVNLQNMGNALKPDVGNLLETTRHTGREILDAGKSTLNYVSQRNQAQQRINALQQIEDQGLNYLRNLYAENVARAQRGEPTLTPAIIKNELFDYVNKRYDDVIKQYGISVHPSTRKYTIENYMNNILATDYYGKNNLVASDTLGGKLLPKMNVPKQDISMPREFPADFTLAKPKLYDPATGKKVEFPKNKNVVNENKNVVSGPSILNPSTGKILDNI